MAKRKPLDSSGVFFDSANIKEFRRWFSAGVIGGATTNPLILQREGILNLPGHISKMINISGPGFPISIEVPDSEMSIKDMINLALKYHSKFPQNAVIKIPMDPREPLKAFEVLYQLGQAGVRVNATLGLGMGQLVGAAEALRFSKAQGDNYISLFWGRREEAREQIIKEMVDSGVSVVEVRDRVPNAAASLKMTLDYLQRHNLQSRVIVGSIRSADQIEEAFFLGADIVTATPQLLRQWMYTKRGVETADEFNQAFRSQKAKITLI